MNPDEEGFRTPAGGSGHEQYSDPDSTAVISRRFGTGVEVRRYTPHLVAEVTFPADTPDMRMALSGGFRQIAACALLDHHRRVCASGRLTPET
jgi:hypothetical protein